MPSYPINFGLNSYQKLFGESLDNSNAKENNITDEEKTNLINMSSINKNSSNKKIYFNIIKNTINFFLVIFEKRIGQKFQMINF